MNKKILLFVFAFIFTIVGTMAIVILSNNRTIKYNVIFDSAGGSDVASQTIEKGGTVIRPDDPIKEGYAFLGWYYNDHVFTFTSEITSDITLIAKWLQKSSTNEVCSLTCDDGYELINVDSKDCSCEKISTEIAVTNIILSKTSLTLEEGLSDTINVDVKPADATNKTVRWTSSNTKVASVNDGVVTAVSVGTATITAKSGDVVASAKVTVKAKNVPVTSVTLNKKTLTLLVGSSETLSAIVAPTNATNQKVIWSSSDTTVATVQNGKVTAVKVGSATIIATTQDGAKTDSLIVTVTAKPISVTSVSLNKSSLSLTVGDSSSLIATITPSNATNQNLTWSSSDTTVASVNNGLVTALKTGTATITVKTADGAKTASATVTVTAKKHTVTFDSNGGSAVSKQTVEDGKKATAPSNPTKDGYNFIGWLLNNVIYDFNTSVTKNITLVASWENQTWDIDSATGSIVKYKGNNENVVIPSLIDGVTISKINSNAFASSSIESVTIPASINKIENSAFLKSANKNLIEVYVKDNLWKNTNWKSVFGTLNSIYVTGDSGVLIKGVYKLDNCNMGVFSGTCSIYRFVHVINSDGIYPIHYDISECWSLNGGTGLLNTEKHYYVTSDSYTLQNPGYSNFQGWIGDNGDVPEKNVVIPIGSSGEKFYTAVCSS